jgi:hypothetical protein
MRHEAHLSTVDAVWKLPNVLGEVPGTLLCDYGKNPVVELTIPSFQVSQRVPGVLQGVMADGSPITLFGAHNAGSKSNGLWTRLSCSAIVAVAGMQLNKLSEFKIDDLVFRIQHLNGWINERGFKWESENNSIAVKLELPPKRTFQVEGGIYVDILSEYTAKDGIDQTQLRQDSYLQFRSMTGFDHSGYQFILNSLRSLLHFAILKPVYPTSVTGFRRDLFRMLGDTRLENDIVIFTKLIKQECESEVLPSRWAFMFPDVSAEFGNFLKRWFHMNEQFDEALQCYFTTIHFNLPSSIDHLCLTQALESFYTVKYHPSAPVVFAKKVEELTQNHHGILPEIKESPEEFAAIVRDNRNWHTHHNPKLQAQGKVLRSGDLFKLNEQLELLFRTCILVEAGIPEQRFFHALRRDRAQEIITLEDL